MSYFNEQVEEHLIKLGLLRFPNVNKIKYVSITDFLEAFFQYNFEHITVSEDNSLECQAGKRRSIGDIFRISKYYVPDITLQQIREGLMDLTVLGKASTIICPDIRKRVWRLYNNDFLCFAEDEFGYDYRELIEKKEVTHRYKSDYKQYLNYEKI